MTGEASETAGLLRRAARGTRRPGAPCWAAPRPAAADGRAPARPPAAGPGRPLRRAPGGVPRRRRAAGRVPPRPDDAVLPLAAADRPASSCRTCTASTSGAQMRDAGREVSLYRGALPEASSAALAAQLLGRLHLAQPGGRPGRAEAPPPGGAQQHGPDRPRGPGPAALRAAEPTPRRPRCWASAGDGGRKRYVRALKRLKEILAPMPGGLEGL